MNDALIAGSGGGSAGEGRAGPGRRQKADGSVARPHQHLSDRSHRHDRLSRDEKRTNASHYVQPTPNPIHHAGRDAGVSRQRSGLGIVLFSGDRVLFSLLRYKSADYTTSALGRPCNVARSEGPPSDGPAHTPPCRRPIYTVPTVSRNASR